MAQLAKQQLQRPACLAQRLKFLDHVAPFRLERFKLVHRLQRNHSIVNA